MYGVLIKKELLALLTSGRFVVSVLVAVALAVSSAWVLVRNYEGEVRAHEAFSAAHGRQIGSYETGAETPLDSLSMGGRILDRAPPVLSVLVAGVYQEQPKAFWVSNYDGPTPETNLVENRLSELFALLDLRFVVGVVFSLLALLVAYDAISGERQKGTLRIILANPVSLRKILLAKWISLSAALALAFLLAFLLSLVIALLNPTVSFAAAEWLRLALIALVSVVYLSLFVTLGLFLSSLFRTPYAAIAVGLVIWVLAVIILPGFAAHGGALATPGLDFVATSAARQDDLGFDWREIMQGYVEQGHGDDEAVAMAEEFWQREVEPKLASHLARTNEGFLNRKSLVAERGRRLARLTPYGSLSFALTELAGTGVGEQLRFERAVERYQREFSAFIREQVRLGRHQEVGASDVPTFSYQPQPAAAFLAPIVVDIASLAVPILLLLFLTFVRMLRYDVR